MPTNESYSSSEEEQQQDVVQLFASEDELDENSERPTTRSVSNQSNTAPITGNEPGKGPGKNAKGKGPVSKKTSKRKKDEPESGNKKQKVDLNPSQIYSMLHEPLKRSENNCNEAGTSGYDNV